MTPTNEAGHGLPERALAAWTGKHRADAENRAFLAGYETCQSDMNAALALSRGVPEGIKDRCDEIGFDDGLDAPAAAGAQGEDWFGDVLASAGEVIPFQAAKPAPQPAAADGGVRDLLARAESAERQVAACKGVLVRWNTVLKFAEEIGYTESEIEVMTLMAEELAIAGAEAALSSHRQAGEPVAFVFHELTGEVRLVWYSQNAMHNPPPSGTKLYTAPPPGPDLSKFRELAVTDEMVERACKKYAFREDGAIWPDAYSEHEVAAERALMREFLEHVLALVEKGAGS